MEVDYCVVATGARNPLRDFGTELKSADTMSALGYYVAGERDDIDIQFLAGLEGYIWVFPRCGHLSVGICGKGEPASALRVRLERYMDEHGLSKDGAAFYSHLLPSLETPAWKRNRVAGDGWLAVGDAAGLVDPITGEGLYYAMRSADLAATAILADTAQAGAAYRKSIRRDFMADLEFGSRLAGRVFHGTFLWGAVHQPHGAVYATESEVPRSDAGPVCRNPALYRTQTQADEKSEWQPGRDPLQPVPLPDSFRTATVRAWFRSLWHCPLPHGRVSVTNCFF